jgi:hypothetical protein
MKFYAYIPTKEGKEPLGTSGRLLFELKTVAGAHRHANKYLGAKHLLFVYHNFYDDKTFRRV